MSSASRVRDIFLDVVRPMLNAHPSSVWGFRLDLFVYRALRIPGVRHDQIRTRKLANGDLIVYRGNRGDIWTVREVFFEECYQIPKGYQPRVIVDLGANIGLTSLWLARAYSPSVIVYVEPLPANMALARMNLAGNGVDAIAVQGAVVKEAGPVHFRSDKRHSLGAVDEFGDITVRGFSMSEILALTPDGKADLLKLDIEGGEGDLLLVDASWTVAVGMIIIEVHPTLVDYSAIVAALVSAGMRYIPADTQWRGQMDLFVRDDWPAWRTTI